jgi:hypothetical protein
MLLCQEHHQLIDSQEAVYTVDRLHAMKEAHERWVETQLGLGVDDPLVVAPPTTDILYSTLLPVDRMPRYVYAADTEARMANDVAPASTPGVVTPFVHHGQRIWAFQNLRDADGPFARHIDRGTVERYDVRTWLGNPDQERLMQQLLNRVLNKLTGRRGLHLDKEHGRYYFPAEEEGTTRSVSYVPLNKPAATRKVVWQPTRKADGAPRKYWLHRAVSLRFLLLDRNAGRWVLSLRPELHITSDGFVPYPSKAVGRRVTQKKSRVFNYDLLGELQFWRDYLSDSSARITLRFSDQQLLVISTSLVESLIQWPGIPAEYAKPFKNVHFVDDLFSWAEANPSPEADDPDDWDDTTSDLEE